MWTYCEKSLALVGSNAATVAQRTCLASVNVNGEPLKQNELV